MKTHGEILAYHRQCGVRQIGDQPGELIDIYDESIRRGSGATGERAPAATDASVVSHPSGDGVQVAQHPARLAVGEPMQAVDLPPVVRGPQGLYRESADVAEAWERFEQDAKALPWFVAAAVVVIACLIGSAVMR